jgi:hypothetical protein
LKNDESEVDEKQWHKIDPKHEAVDLHIGIVVLGVSQNRFLETFAFSDVQNKQIASIKLD